MKKYSRKYLTRTDTLAVMTGVLVATLFIIALAHKRSHPPVSQRSLQLQSTMNIKHMIDSIQGHFTDVRKKHMPNLKDVFGADYASKPFYICPAGSGTHIDSYLGLIQKPNTKIADYGYTGLSGSYEIIDKSDFNCRYAKKSAIDSTDLWLSCNNEDSPILSSYQQFNKTVSLQPVAYGDGRSGILGQQ